jgi:7,8-dihydropterin-6-yl-methyl-4-(beta-D-ribofuranosyl)aminobenzene 5'-phosphate synthase
MTLAPADRLEVLVLVDNLLDNLSSVPGFVTRERTLVERRGLGGWPTAGESLCCATHGLSFVVTAYGAAGTRTMLFDGGPSPHAAVWNAERLGVDFGAVGAAMLSHGHWDHAGGLPGLLERVYAARGGRVVPLYLHPGMFHERGSRQPDGSVQPMDPLPSPQQWRRAGAEPVVTETPQTCLGGMFFVSGEIPRCTAYEKGVASQMGRAGPDAPWQPEPLLMDERFLAVEVAGKGLVVLSACSHAGIVNVLHHARASFPGVKLHAVMGGFHLSGPTEAAIADTVQGLDEFDLDIIVPAHCTGWRAVNALERRYGEKVVPTAAGKLFSF